MPDGRGPQRRQPSHSTGRTAAQCAHGMTYSHGRIGSTGQTPTPCGPVPYSIPYSRDCCGRWAVALCRTDRRLWPGGSQCCHRIGRYNSLRVGLGPRGADTCTPQPQPLMAEAAEPIDAVKVTFHYSRFTALRCAALRCAALRCAALRCMALSLSLLFAHRTRCPLARTARLEAFTG